MTAAPRTSAPRPWRRTRRSLAAMAVLTAAVTGAASAGLGGSAWHVYGAGVYVAVAAVAVLAPAAITIQVIAGQALAGSVLLGQSGPAALLLLPVVAGVVTTAELLALVARLETPFERDPADGLRRLAGAAVIGGGVFGAVVLVGELPGPTGLLAIALASAACVLLAILLLATGRSSSPTPTDSGGNR